MNSEASSQNEPSGSTTESPQCECITVQILKNKHVSDLVYWRDVKKSGIVFGAGLLLLLSLACCSIISVVSYASLIVLVSSLSYRVYSTVLQAVQKTTDGHPFKDYLERDIQPSKQRVYEVVDVALDRLTNIVEKMRKIFLVEEIVDSLKFVVLFWVMTYIGAWFNGITLIILAYLAAFSLPKLYEMNKAQVDQYLQIACTQTRELIAQVKAKIPLFAGKKEKPQ